MILNLIYIKVIFPGKSIEKRIREYYNNFLDLYLQFDKLFEGKYTIYEIMQLPSTVFHDLIRKKNKLNQEDIKQVEKLSGRNS